MFEKQWYKNILLTGEPWCGKSTLLWAVIQWIRQKQGILTKQVVDLQWIRTGFELETTEWIHYPLASKTEQTSILFAEKWYIQPQGLQEVIKDFKRNIGDLLYLDEIAPMQMYTPWFVEFTDRLLDTTNPLLWVIKYDDTDYPYIQKAKSRKDVLVLTLNDQSRQSIELFLENLIKKLKKSQQYVHEPYRYLKLSNSSFTMESEDGHRMLQYTAGVITCNCDFYIRYGICSHSMALRQLQPQLT